MVNLDAVPGKANRLMQRWATVRFSMHWWMMHGSSAWGRSFGDACARCRRVLKRSRISGSIRIAGRCW